jgi:uncharacterized protein YdhG (YjbR/CyaY superfamily)
MTGPGRRKKAVAKTDFKSVDEYIATLPGEVQGKLQRVRSTIRKALPEAEEGISYQIPVYKQHGGAVLYFAGWKEHFSLYPASGALVGAFAHELEPYVVSKGTIRFPLSKSVPVRLIGRIAKFRAEETLARQQSPKKSRQGGAKPAAKKR